MSKENWRLLKLKGDERFMESLYQFPANFKFQLGPSYIQIRGGEWCEEEDSNKQKRPQETKAISNQAVECVLRQEDGNIFPEGANTTYVEKPSAARGAWADNLG